MRSRVFTAATTGDLQATALQLRNENEPRGIGSLATAIMTAMTAAACIAIHSNGVIEVTEEVTDNADILALEFFSDTPIVSTVLAGIGDGRSKVLSTDGVAYVLTTDYADNDSPLNSLMDLMSKPVAPTVTALSAINDTFDFLTDLIELNPDYSAFTIFVNQSNTTIVVILHNGFNGAGNVKQDTIFNNAGETLVAAGFPADFVERFVGVIPTATTPGGAPRTGWE